MSYFTKEELSCKCGCDLYYFDEQFLELLNAIRSQCGFPLPVSSGYRCPQHPVESAKPKPGAHSTGKAVDIAVSHWQAYTVAHKAMELGVWRVGINQKGPTSSRFIHLDVCPELPAPAIWSY